MKTTNTFNRGACRMHGADSNVPGSLIIIIIIIIVRT